MKRQTPPPAARPKRSTSGRFELAVVLVVVAAIVAAAHWPVLGARAQSLDDDLFVTSNPLVTRPGWPSTWRFFSEVLHPSSVAGYYIPVSMTSLMLDVAMGGGASDFRAFHRTNLLLHVLSTLLIVLILYQLFGSAIPAGIAGLLFGVHPFTVESLAWISQRKTLLAACFGFASIAAYVRHRRGGGRWWQPAAIALYALALMSKPTVVSLPVLLLVLDAWPLKRLTRQAVVEKWPFFLLSLASSSIAVLSQVGAVRNGAVPETGPIRLFLQACYLQLFYVGQLLWPRDLSALHPPPNPVALSNPTILISAILACLLMVVLFALAKRWRAPLAGWTFYLVALAPTFGVLVWSAIYTYDHYLYFPVLGILLFVGAGLHSAWSSRIGHRWIIPVLAGVVIVAAAAEVRATRATLRHWQGNDALWQRILTILPDYPLIREMYGTLLTQDGRLAEAVTQLQQSVDQEPGNAEFRYNLGVALSLEGRLDAALVEFQAATTHAPADTGYVREFARSLRKAGKLAEAEEEFRALLRLKVEDTEALGQLATLLAARGEVREAIELARRSVTAEPGSARTHFTLGLVLAHGGVEAEAVGHLRESVRLDPGWPDAYNELAWLLATSPDPKVLDPREALSLSQRAVELSGGVNPGVLDTHAAAQAAAGHYVPAVATAEAAARLADSLHVDTLAKTIRGRIATYRRGLRFVEQREAPGTP